MRCRRQALERQIDGSTAAAMTLEIGIGLFDTLRHLAGLDAAAPLTRAAAQVGNGRFTVAFGSISRVVRVRPAFGFAASRRIVPTARSSRRGRGRTCAEASTERREQHAGDDARPSGQTAGRSTLRRIRRRTIAESSNATEAAAIGSRFAPPSAVNVKTVQR